MLGSWRNARVSQPGRLGSGDVRELGAIPTVDSTPQRNWLAALLCARSSLVDLVPTIVPLCDGQLADGLQGADISELALGGDEPINQGVAGEFHSVNWTDPLHPLRMWVEERWKYVESQDGSDELYDLQDDPLEERNLIASPEHLVQLIRSRQGLSRWLDATSDTWPEDVQPPPRPARLGRPVV